MTVRDKWEYPWFAAWDLAFQCIPLALVDPDFAKNQLWLLLFEQFQHPNGQIPALRVGVLRPQPAGPRLGRLAGLQHGPDPLGQGRPRLAGALLPQAPDQLHLVDQQGRPRGQQRLRGGVPRARQHHGRRPLAHCLDGSTIEQSDATGWMGMFCLNLMRIALELARENNDVRGPGDQVLPALHLRRRGDEAHGTAGLFALGRGGRVLLRRPPLPRRPGQQLRVRSLVGLIPLFAVERLEEDWIEPFEEFRGHFHWFLKHRPELVKGVVHTVEHDDGITHALTILNQRADPADHRRIMDPAEFLSDYGIRSLSKAHEAHPFDFEGQSVGYEPAESLEQDQGGELELAGAALVPDLLPPDRVAPEAGQGVRRRRARRRDARRPFRRDGPRDRRADDRHLRPRRVGPPPRLRRLAPSSRTTPTGATTSSSTNTSTATPVPGSGRRTRPAGPP